METIIPIHKNEGQQCVNARELHGFLESKQKFADWIKDRISKYGFTQGLDYEVTNHKTGKRQNVLVTDYLISIDMAKELSMVERNQKGKQARQYFIECEKRLRDAANPSLTFEEQVIHTLSMAREKVEALECKVEELEPKADFFDTVTKSNSVCQMAVACNVAKLPYGRNILYRKLREDGVLLSGGKRHNLPKQSYINQGLFTVDESKYEHPKTGEPFMSFTTHVTQKGIDWIIKHYGDKNLAA